MCFGCGWGGTILGFAGGYMVGRETSNKPRYLQDQKPCQVCNTSIDVNSRFCPYCGKEQTVHQVSYNVQGPLELLKERYARGELSTEEFHKIKKDLE